MICTSIATHGIANSFVIVQTGNLKFRLYYMLQSYFFVGLMISAKYSSDNNSLNRFINNQREVENYQNDRRYKQ
jgi:hypothetical protein